jgi:hypothetical protein
MHSGLRGIVSTFQSDQSQITSMIDGKILPSSPQILAAIIGITYIRPNNLPEKSMPDIFRVRH